MANKISKLSELSALRNQYEFDRFSKQSYKWFIGKINNLRNPTSLAMQIKKETNRNSKTFVLGGLYYMYYNAKTKDKLKYWDAFPLVIPMERYNDGFLGLNLHYLPVRFRVAFMDKLMNFALYDENDEVKRLRVTYEILSTAKRYKEFKPCLKRYLYSQVASKILKIQPNEWETAVFLPVHQFQGAKAKDVWQDSMQDIKNQDKIPGMTDVAPTIGHT